jgi:hypothetical protein
MKLRIKGNSIRLRLSQSEVEEFNSSGFFEETTRLGTATNDVFYYRLQKSEVLNIAAKLEDRRILVDIPTEMAGQWALSDQVGMEHYQETGRSEQLRILIEKDFQCLKPRAGEDESDNFPNSEAGTV